MREDEAVTKSGRTGLVMAGIVIAAGLFIGFRTDTDPSEEEQTAVVAPEPSDPTDPAVPQEPTSAEGETAEDAAAMAGADTPVSPVENTSDLAVPSIDEVRLESDGLTVIAGSAAPGSTVSVLVDGVEVATAEADDRGDFAAVAVVEPSDAARVLTLNAETGEGVIASTEDVILAPAAAPVETAQASDAPKSDANSGNHDATSAETVAGAETQSQSEKPSDTPDVPAQADRDPEGSDTASSEQSEAEQLAAAPGAGTSADEGAGDNTVGLAAPEPRVVDPDVDDKPAAPPETPSDTPAKPDATAQTETATSSEPEADEQSVTVLKSTADGVDLLQPDIGPAPNVAIDTIGYSDTGDVQLAGRAIPGTFEVRVYLNNRFVASIPVATDGTWRCTIADVAAGVYILRVDEMNTASVVTSRIETPFKREEPDVLAEATEGQDGPVTAATVQAGDTLWAIARDRYGEGLLYVRVFEANISAIRDPDLIYPGQVFDLPVE